MTIPVPSPPLPASVTGTIAIESGGHFLLFCLSPTEEGPLRWQFPQERVCLDESPIAAALRAARAAGVPEVEVTGVQGVHYARWGSRDGIGIGFHLTGFPSKGNADTIAPTDGYKWVPRDELAELLHRRRLNSPVQMLIAQETLSGIRYPLSLLTVVGF